MDGFSKPRARDPMRAPAGLINTARPGRSHRPRGGRRWNPRSSDGGLYALVSSLAVEVLGILYIARALIAGDHWKGTQGSRATG